MKKKRHFVPVGNTNRDKRVRQPRGRWLHLLSRLVLPTETKGPLLSRLPDPGHLLLSRTGVPGWETGTTAVSQPGQINVFVVVTPSSTFMTMRPNTRGGSSMTLSRCPPKSYLR